MPTEKAAILIATFRRNDLLNVNLTGLCKQDIKSQVIILDDSHIEDKECKTLIYKYRNELKINYIHTGKNKNESFWRVPGFAFNIGVKNTNKNFIILCCAEIFHQNNTIEKLIEPFNKFDKGIMSIPHGKYDRGNITKIIKTNIHISDNDYSSIKESLKTEYPFLMGMSRDDFMEIGGYDEDFTGVAAEDRDLVERLIDYGCKYVQTDAKIIHLHHSRNREDNRENTKSLVARKRYNQRLYRTRKGIIFRNQDKEWGIL